MSNRKDNWTEEEDQVLLKVVLSHIRNGSTQLKAFEEVAEKFNRTPSACGFRWNNNLRKLHEDEIKAAKKYRLKDQKENGTDTKRILRVDLQEKPSNHIEKSVQEQKDYICSLIQQLPLNADENEWKIKYESLKQEHDELVRVMKDLQQLLQIQQTY